MGRRKIIVLVCVGLAAMVVGFAETYLADFHGKSEALFVPHTIANAIFAREWFRADLAERNASASLLLSIMIWLVTIIALPYYFFRSRGLVGGAKSTGLFVVFIGLLFGLYWCGSWLSIEVFERSGTSVTE